LATDNRRIDQLSERYDGARVQAQQVGANLAAARSALAATDSQAQVLISYGGQVVKGVS
jgi:hypothetical protein